jgi:hypothetical protein
MKAKKTDLIGRRIVAVDFRPFDNGRGETADDPILTLDDGSKLCFIVQETEVGEYGVRLCFIRP